jgi:hypothetical protein
MQETRTEILLNNQLTLSLAAKHLVETITILSPRLPVPMLKFTKANALSLELWVPL